VTQTAQTETVRPNRPDRKVLFRLRADGHPLQTP